MKSIKKLIGLVIVSFLCLGLIFQFWISWSSAEYCDGLKVKSIDPTVKALLVRWTEEYVIDERLVLDSNKFIVGGGMQPGRYLYRIPVPWEKIGFDKRSQVRIVSEYGLSKSEYLTKIDAIFFGERSRFGFLVKMPDSEGFGVEPRFLNEISGRVAVYCAPGD